MAKRWEAIAVAARLSSAELLRNRQKPVSPSRVVMPTQRDKYTTRSNERQAQLKSDRRLGQRSTHRCFEVIAESFRRQLL